MQTNHFRKASCGDDVSCVDQTIEMSGRLLDLLPHVIVAVEVECVRDEFKSILIVLNFRIEARQVEPICQVVFVYLAEVFVPS